MALLHAIRSPSKPLRHVVGTNVAVIVGVGGLPTWPELLMSFVQCLESSDPNALEGALDALYKVDCCPARDHSYAERCSRAARHILSGAEYSAEAWLDICIQRQISTRHQEVWSHAKLQECCCAAEEQGGLRF